MAEETHLTQVEAHLKDYFNIVKHRRKVFYVFFIAVVAIVTVGSFIMTPLYRATCTVFIDMPAPNVLTVTDAIALGSQSYFAYKEYYQSQKEIIRSRSIAHEIIKEFNLMQDKDYEQAKEPVDKFLKTVSVESVRDTRLAKIHVDNRDPALAANIANRIAELYVNQNLAYITKYEMMNLLKNEYLKLQSKLSEYNKVYKDKHPKMIRIKQEIAQMAEKIELEKKRALGYDFKEDVMGEGLDSIATTSILDGLKANNVRIQDPAEVPRIPIRPKKRLNIALAILVGLFGGSGLALFLEYLDTTVKKPSDIERYLELPILGYIPKIQAQDKTLSDEEKDLVSFVEPMSMASEAYRAVRTSLLLASGDEKKHIKDMIVTSPGPVEGKTITACNLGIVFSQIDKKVLLVDADLRRPRLHEIFGVDNVDGLTNFIKGECPFDRAIKKTKIENLFVTPAGTHSMNPSEMLSSEAVEDFITEAKQKFDFIILDSPPVAVVTDAAVLARFIGGVITVVESGKTARDIFPRVKSLLDSVHAKSLGIVVNDISHPGDTYHYSYYYYGKRRKK